MNILIENIHFLQRRNQHLADENWEVGKKEMANIKHTWLSQIFYTHNTDTK